MQDARKKPDARPYAHPECWETAPKWVIAGNHVALVFLREIAPYLVIKRAQAELLASGYAQLSAEERAELYVRLRQLRREA
jgi:hypothetical protein